MTLVPPNSVDGAPSLVVGAHDEGERLLPIERFCGIRRDTVQLTQLRLVLEAVSGEFLGVGKVQLVQLRGFGYKVRQTLLRACSQIVRIGVKAQKEEVSSLSSRSFTAPLNSFIDVYVRRPWCTRQ